MLSRYLNIDTFSKYVYQHSLIPIFFVQVLVACFLYVMTKKEGIHHTRIHDRFPLLQLSNISTKQTFIDPL